MDACNRLILGGVELFNLYTVAFSRGLHSIKAKQKLGASFVTDFIKEASAGNRANNYYSIGSFYVKPDHLIKQSFCICGKGMERKRDAFHMRSSGSFQSELNYRLNLAQLQTTRRTQAAPVPSQDNTIVQIYLPSNYYQKFRIILMGQKYC